jgi:hypothetical protein
MCAARAAERYGSRIRYEIPMRPADTADRSIDPAVADYLNTLPPDRREAIDAVRAVILANLPEGYEEAFNWGMLAYQVPLADYPNTYNGQPMMYAALASQKRYMSLYLMAVYGDEGQRASFEAAYEASGKRLDMGKSCVRFAKLDDLPLDVVGDAIAALPPKLFLARVEAARTARTERGAR